MIWKRSSKHLSQSITAPFLLLKKDLVRATFSGSYQIRERDGIRRDYLGDHRKYSVDCIRFQERNEKEQEKEFLSFLNTHSSSNYNKNDGGHNGHRDKELDKAMKTKTLQQLEKERQELFNEARAMTLSFYRTCIRCTKIVGHGNESDEQDFQAREEEQRLKRTDIKKMMSSSSSLSFEPPVDRENELLSRSSYYLAFVKESFGQEVDCLTQSIPWREDNVIRFEFLMKQGEERRSWTLKSYKFDDPYHDSSQEILLKVESWNERAHDLVKKVYRTNGWLLSSDYVFEEVKDMTMEQAMEDDGDLDWDDEMDKNDR